MSIVKAPDLLMPKEGTDMRKWAVVACDQFTSQPEYWDKLDKLVGQEPSTLRIVSPRTTLPLSRESTRRCANISTTECFATSGSAWCS